MNGLHRVSAAAIAIAAVLAIKPHLAHASAAGVEPVPAFSIDTKGVAIPIPKGVLFHSIDGEHRTIKYGKACAKLYVNGKHRAPQCHFITMPRKIPWPFQEQALSSGA